MNPLGIALEDLLRTPGLTGTPNIPAPSPASPSRYSKGQIIAGILADALAGAAGQRGPMAAMWGREREQQQEQAQWGLRRQAGLEDYEAKQKIDQRYREPDVAPALRDAQAWAAMTEDQRAAYEQMKQAGQGDPDVFVTLPNGQVYAGPKSGLAQALMGGAPQPAAPPKPVGKLTPIQGGLTPRASGTFRP